MENNDYKKTSKRRLVLIILLIIIIIILLLLKSCDCKKTETDNPLQLDPNQQEITEESIKEENKKNRQIVMPGWGTIKIAKDTTYIDTGIDFYNPTKNTWYECPDCGAELDEDLKCPNDNKQWTEDTAVVKKYYMTFALYLEENDELLYQSGLVEPNKHITSIELSRPLSKGEYDAYVFIQPYKTDMVTTTNSGKVKIKLIAQ